MYVDLFLKLVIGFGVLLTVIRLLGKKELAQLTPYDFVYTLVLGGILEESLFDDKVKVTHFLFGITLWAVLIYVIEKATKRWNLVRVLLKGKTVKLISNGELDMHAFDKNHLEMEQLRSALRKQGVFSLREVRDMFLEPSGNLTINKYKNYDVVTNGDLTEGAKDEEPTVLLIDEGVVKEDVLNFAGKDRAWLMDELRKKGLPDPEEIAYGEWSDSEGLFIKTYS